MNTHFSIGGAVAPTLALLTKVHLTSSLILNGRLMYKSEIKWAFT